VVLTAALDEDGDVIVGAVGRSRPLAVDLLRVRRRGTHEQGVRRAGAGASIC